MSGHIIWAEGRFTCHSLDNWLYEERFVLFNWRPNNKMFDSLSLFLSLLYLSFPLCIIESVDYFGVRDHLRVRYLYLTRDRQTDS